jgi:ABC-type protease/lipase transport system fused ATPase/permease subunit
MILDLRTPPGLVLLDEPTGNLDADSSEALEKALDGIQGTVVAVSSRPCLSASPSPLPHGPPRPER